MYFCKREKKNIGTTLEPKTKVAICRYIFICYIHHFNIKDYIQFVVHKQYVFKCVSISQTLSCLTAKQLNQQYIVII